MFCLKKYYIFNKLLKFLSVSGFKKLPLHEKKYFLSFKVCSFYKFYYYYNSFLLFLFTFKLRNIFKKLLLIKSTNIGFINQFGKFCLILSYNSLISNNFQQILKPLLFSSFHCFKATINKKNVINKKNLKNFKFISFLIILLGEITSFLKFKTKTLCRYNLPILFLSKVFLSNSYFLPMDSNLKKTYFWSFLIVSIALEELNAKKKN